MSNQQLDFSFYACAEDATQAAIHKSGKPLKAVAYELWPALKMDTAYSRLRGCLNHDRPEKLTADEHLMVARITNQFDFLHYCAQELHHTRPEPVAPEDEAAALKREMLRLGADMKGLFARLEQIEDGNKVRRLKTA
ncbi:MAG: hypothetical protein ACLFSG_09615 [Halothiobacillaceae bacterium]